MRLRSCAPFFLGSSLICYLDYSSPQLMLQVGRDLPAILSQLSHDLLGQPDIHGCRIVGVPGVVEFLSQLLARDKLLTKSKTFIKSTIECRQSSFSFFCAASLVSTASTSTFE